MSGSTTGTIRMATGNGPSCKGVCPPGTVCREVRTVLSDGTINLCCVCEAVCYCPGDVFADGVLNGKDIQAFVNCLLGVPNPDPQINCACVDFDGDGPGLSDIPFFVHAILDKQPCPQAVCGNGIVEPGEQCDDGNQAAGDGCDQNCRLE
ncbi:MAG: DUF4215 domain-containing protein [Phycisphaerae bacterium]|nr:DUF4215 domain-containing protein [Phycisphaerae bacterium]